MEWHRLTDGRFEKLANGVSLALDPHRLSLRIVVTDYHASPIDVDLVELQSVIALPMGQVRRHALGREGAWSCVLRFLKRHVPTFLVGALVVFAILHARARGSGEQK